MVAKPSVEICAENAVPIGSPFALQLRLAEVSATAALALEGAFGSVNVDTWAAGLSAPPTPSARTRAAYGEFAISAGPAPPVPKTSERLAVVDAALTVANPSVEIEAA